MRVEVETGIAVAAKTVADLRSLPAWPDGLALNIHVDLAPRFSVVRVERASSCVARVIRIADLALIGRRHRVVVEVHVTVGFGP
jgi:hypothetical protein